MYKKTTGLFLSFFEENDYFVLRINGHAKTDLKCCAFSFLINFLHFKLLKHTSDVLKKKGFFQIKISKNDKFASSELKTFFKFCKSYSSELGIRL